MNATREQTEAAFLRVWPEAVFQWGTDRLTVIVRRDWKDEMGPKTLWALMELPRATTWGRLVSMGFGAHLSVASFDVMYDIREKLPEPPNG